MNPLFLVVIMGLISGLVMSIWKWRAEKLDKDPAKIASDQNAEEKYTALCESGETISVVCRGYKNEYYVLTNRRLIIDNKKGFHSIPLDTVTKVVLRKADGGKVKQASECQVMTVYADKKYAMARYSNKFDKISAYFFDRR